jgi:hypothetical protein
MPSSLATLLIIAFAGLLLGLVAGLLIASMRSDSEDDVQPEQDSPPGGRSGRYLPVLRLWREKTTATLIVELEGKSYLSTEPLTISQREALEIAAGELVGWLGAEVAEVPVVQAANANKVVTDQPAAAYQPAALDGRQPVQPAPARTPEIALVTPPPAGQAQRAAVVVPVAPILPIIKEEPKSIVGQIDAILQEMLLRSGLENRGISITEDPRKGVVVWVGLDHFDGIDAVADAEIKGIIRSAVGEWERRQEMNTRY